MYRFSEKWRLVQATEKDIQGLSLPSRREERVFASRTLPRQLRQCLGLAGAR